MWDFKSEVHFTERAWLTYCSIYSKNVKGDRKFPMKRGQSVSLPNDLKTKQIFRCHLSQFYTILLINTFFVCFTRTTVLPRKLKNLVLNKKHSLSLVFTTLLQLDHSVY